MMKPKFYPLLQQCIEHGLERGWYRAHKHNDDPSSDTIQYNQYEAIMSELHEWFEFEQGDDIE